MEWIDRMNHVIDEIENSLTVDSLDLARLARIGGCSAYHLQRMFTYMAGVPLSEYVRRRKLSRAADDLRQPGAKVIDVALRYGYASPTAFNRAFQALHGIAPSKVAAGASVRFYPPLRFTFTVKGGEEMQYRIESKSAFNIVGISHPLAQEIEQNFAEVPAMWQQAAADGAVTRLASLIGTGQGPLGILGVSACGDEDDWCYFIAAASDADAPGFVRYTVPAATWAIFPGEGAGVSIQQLEQRIITEWLPASGYEYADAPDIEVYLDPNPAQTKYEVWIPVMRVEK